MSAQSTRPGLSIAATGTALTRWLLGGVFLYLGWNKALHPAEFLVALRQYHLIEGHLLLNLIAVVLPWLEIFCGLLLVAGVAVRGCAVLLLAMLTVFSWIVLQRALALHDSTLTPLCAIRFDCGCGQGEVRVCHKLLENLALVFLSIILLLGRPGRWCLRHALIAGR